MKRLILCVVSIIAFLSFCNGQSSDCSEAIRICNYGKYLYNEVEGFGKFKKEKKAKSKDLNNSIIESNSIWLFWDTEETGDFVFSLNPIEDSDDYDFTLYKSLNGTCDRLDRIREVTSGPNLPSLKNSEPCIGKTGLSYSSEDLVEKSGCDKNSDNYAKYVQSNINERYYLLINNYNSTIGFEFEFQGIGAINNEACQDGLTRDLDEFNLRPNPVSNDLFVDLGKSIGQISELIIINSVGQIQQFRKIQNSGLGQTIKIDVSQLTPGHYTLRVAGQSTVEEKSFVKI